MRCENKTFLQNDPGFLQEISSTAVEVGLAWCTVCAGIGTATEGTKHPVDSKRTDFRRIL